MTEHLPPAGLNIRGTVLVVPGRGESPLSYARFGRRLAADAYHVRILPPGAAHSPAELGAALTAAVHDLPTSVVRPLVLAGSDTGAAVLAALLATHPETVRAVPAVGPASGSDAEVAVPSSVLPAAGADSVPPWWPEAVVLAGLPGHDRRHDGDWEQELDARSHCPVHRGVLSDDAAVVRGALAAAAPAELLDSVYGSASPVPHLLLVGETDPLADRDALTRLVKTLPAARLSVVRGAHHDVLNDVSHRSVAAEVVSFLEAVRDGVPPRPFVRAESSAW
ncbi:hypothetical protein GCM10010112_85230 [Actinoplanes lobatus]|uniref:Alpha-beta hydrolase superfamily lysophospholipase n=1 Tax=Actinoplanes lobatus TaxID=113568 RepID=A0A7W7HG44_9ACTN|nr:alpha/beta hydrolase [Actinoplanes lobatus]MBB4749920.1 alpha-beta hydrolase superfamily lysophospholipase [Actinoplanes lobatus]GGN95196.1 hypothetical protein GCM10010112_85230 [Actinoplanes lobatus]GIE45011.1 hypothetical protein Alo02nite_79090 [Actinoplanes lobatus]